MSTIKFVINDKFVELNETQEILNLLNTDDDFTYDYFQRALEENKLAVFGVTSDSTENFKIIRLGLSERITETELDNEPNENNLFMGDAEMVQQPRTVSRWTTDATKLLLALYQQYTPSVGKTAKVKNKKILWRVIASEMQKQNYNFNCVQIENRYKTLDRGYKEMTQNNKKTGRSRASCEFQKELETINKDRRTVFPEFILGSSGDGESNKQLKEKAGISSSQNRTSDLQLETTDSSPLPSKRRRDTILIELQKMRKEKDKKREQDCEVKLKMLELEQKKIEAYKERSDILKKKNQILEEYLQNKYR